MDHTTQQKSTALHLAILALMVFTSACTVPAQLPTTMVIPSSTVPTATQPASSTPVFTASPTLLPPSVTPSLTPLPPSQTPTIIKSATRAPTSTTAPTSTLINQKIKLSRNTGTYLLSYEDGGLMVVYNNLIERIDLSTGKVIQSTKVGCEVCFGACDQFAAARDGQYYWVLQFGGIGENKCYSEQPWANIGFSLRRIKPGNSDILVIDVSSIVNNFDYPDYSILAVKDDIVYLAYAETVYVIDAARSTKGLPYVVKKFFPGMIVEGMLIAYDTLWIAGESLLAVNPKTFTVGTVYPLVAQLLATDGKTMWGISRDLVTLQSIDLSTRKLGELIDLPEVFYGPSAVAFDGKGLWISFAYDTRLVMYPVK